MDSDSSTLTQFMLSQESLHQTATGHLTTLLHALEIASKYVSVKIRSCGLSSRLGVGGGTSESETAAANRRLDVVAREAFVTSLKRSRTCRVIVTGDMDDAILVPVEHRDPKAHYAVAIRCLDGSSNLETNISIGSTFGIWRTPDAVLERGEAPSVAEVLRKGSEMAAAGYVSFGSTTQFFLTTGHSVEGFTLDPASGEFVHSFRNVKIPDTFPLYSVNCGNRSKWSASVKSYVSLCETRGYALRYQGSMVADVNLVLACGGIFLYPTDSSSPNGKLYVLYEGFPMAWLCHVAGGKCTDGVVSSFLDIVPASIHERRGFFAGSPKMIDEIVAMMKS